MISDRYNDQVAAWTNVEAAGYGDQNSFAIQKATKNQNLTTLMKVRHGR